ncbi:hypothetical protein HHI36_009919, partial [Cryptolaemus montrouzieri]
ITAKDPSFKDKVSALLDGLKQKIKALGNRTRRYNERSKRFRYNNFYCRNQKQFFRDLEEKSPHTVYENPTSYREMHEFRSGIRSQEVVHDDNADWIKEVEARTPRYEMREIQITADDIERVQKNSNNWAAPGQLLDQ